MKIESASLSLSYSANMTASNFVHLIMAHYAHASWKCDLLERKPIIIAG